ncbi:hypothetical protein Peur_055603 [Populus x canadensis]
MFLVKNLVWYCFTGRKNYANDPVLLRKKEVEELKEHVIKSFIKTRQQEMHGHEHTIKSL